MDFRGCLCPAVGCRITQPLKLESHNFKNQNVYPNTLMKGYLAKKGIHLLVKRGRRKLGLLDAYLKSIKTKLITYLKIHPQASFPPLLDAIVQSYNNTYSDIIKGKPAELNSNYFDAKLRQKLYKDKPAFTVVEINGR